MTKTLLASTLATALLGGCLTEEPATGSTQGETFEEYKAKVPREVATGYYLVDWDVVIADDERLYEHWQELQSGQALSIYRINGADVKWSDTQKVNLTYCYGNTFGGNLAAIQAAMNGATVQGWERFANIKFVHVPAQDGAGCNANNANVVFDINQVNSGGQYLARAFFPNSPRAQRNVLVDPASFNPQQTGGISVTNIMIHELGHALGFRHEHIARPNQATQGCVEDANYRVIDGYDQVSTMHYPQCGSPGNTLALSPKDQTGVAAVYGAPLNNMPPVASVSAPANNTTVPPTFTVDALVSDGNNNLQKVELFIDGTLYGQPKTTAPYQFQVMNLALGPHQLTVKATDAAGAVTTTQVTNVTVAQSGGDGGGNGGGGGNGTGGGNGMGDGDSTDVSGGCSTGGGSVGILFGLGLLGLVARRRRR